MINTVHLEDTNIYLENFISELTGTGQDATHVARLQARSMFKDIRAEGEEYIFKKLVSRGCLEHIFENNCTLSFR